MNGKNAGDHAGNNAGSGDGLGSNKRPGIDDRPKHINKQPVSHGLKSRALREGRIKPFRGNNKKAIAIKRWQAALIADLGGESEITAAQWQLIDSITRLRGRIDYADLWMSKQPTLIGLDQGFYPAVGQWRMLIETMSKLLNQLFPDGIAKRIQRELTAEIADQRLLEAKKARLEAASKAGGIQEAGEPEEAEIGSGQGPNPQ